MMPDLPLDHDSTEVVAACSGAAYHKPKHFDKEFGAA
jgi:hypothetical protein